MIISKYMYVKMSTGLKGCFERSHTFFVMKRITDNVDHNRVLHNIQLHKCYIKL